MSRLTTWTALLASLTWITPPEYSGAIFTAVCVGLVVAPPTRRGIVKPSRSIMRAISAISARLGVMSPETPTTS